MRRSDDGVQALPSGATDRVREDVPRLVDACHGRGRGSCARIGVVLLRQSPIRTRDLLARRGAGNAQDGIGIDLGHQGRSLRRHACYPVARDHEAREEAGRGRGPGLDGRAVRRRRCRRRDRPIGHRCPDRRRAARRRHPPLPAPLPERDGRPAAAGRRAWRRAVADPARGRGTWATPHGRRSVRRARRGRRGDAHRGRPSLAHRARGRKAPDKPTALQPAKKHVRPADEAARLPRAQVYGLKKGSAR